MSFPMLSPTRGQIPTRYSPVRHSHPAETRFPFDLHVLSMPPAFNLSQDQTLQFKPSSAASSTRPASRPEPAPDTTATSGSTKLSRNSLGLQVHLRQIFAAHEPDPSAQAPTQTTQPICQRLSPTRSFGEARILHATFIPASSLFNRSPPTVCFD